MCITSRKGPPNGFDLLKTLKRIPSITKEDMFAVYKHLILSVLEYNSPLLVGCSKRDAQLLEKVQKRCHRIICGKNCDFSCLPLLAERRLQQSMRIFCAAISNKSHPLNKYIPPFLRHSSKLSVQYRRTQSRATSFFPFCTLLYMYNDFK